MDISIRCPECGEENSYFARFMNLSRCRECGHDLEFVEVSELLRRGGIMRGRSDLYEYELSRESISFFPRGVMVAPPLNFDLAHRFVRISGDLGATQGVSMLWNRLKGSREEIPFDRVVRVEVVYQLQKLSQEDHPYRHHWDVALMLDDQGVIPLGRITAERQFPGPVRSHHHALRLAHALHELIGWPMNQREKEAGMEEEMESRHERGEEKAYGSSPEK